MIHSSLRLFKALPIEVKGKKKATNNLVLEAIKRGFIFSPEIIYNYSESELIDLARNIGLTPEQLNSSFHKSWHKVKTAPMLQLVLEQMLHYITTYGFESLGIYNKDSVYLPKEELNIPELKDDIVLTVIKGYTKSELKSKCMGIATSGIALKKETLTDLVTILKVVGVSVEDIELVKNKELKLMLYKEAGLIPRDSIEFLRYAVYYVTEDTLLIKSSNAIAKIKNAETDKLVSLFKDYETLYGLVPLARIFYRFKPIFLAFKSSYELRPVINEIRRLAKTHHKPMAKDMLNSVTESLKTGYKFNASTLESELNSANVFRKIRLACALNYRTKDASSIVYKVRNGKSFATDFSFSQKKQAKDALSIVLSSIIKDIEPNVKGKKIYYPDNIEYTLPATEKQFIGNVPCGSYSTIKDNTLVGVHWSNVKRNKIDLDLSLVSLTGKVGWDGFFRSNTGDILFSGDMTDAPNGASELFYIKQQKKDAYLVCLNYYNYDESVPVPFSVVVASERPVDLSRNYMVQRSSIVSEVQSKIDQKQKVLGLLVTGLKENKFYFAEFEIGRANSAGNSKYSEQTRNYLLNFYQNSISLRRLLENADAVFVADKKDADIDLSIEALEKDTILNLIQGRY